MLEMLPRGLRVLMRISRRGIYLMTEITGQKKIEKSII